MKYKPFTLDPSTSLGQHVQLINQMQKKFEYVLANQFPELVHQCCVANINATKIIVAAKNASVATALRFISPELQNYFKKEVRVYITEKFELIAEPVKKDWKLSERSKQTLAQLLKQHKHQRFQKAIKNLIS